MGAFGGDIVTEASEKTARLGVEKGLEVCFEVGLMARKREKGGCWGGR